MTVNELLEELQQIDRYGRCDARVVVFNGYNKKIEEVDSIDTQDFRDSTNMPYIKLFVSIHE